MSLFDHIKKPKTDTPVPNPFANLGKPAEPIAPTPVVEAMPVSSVGWGEERPPTTPTSEASPTPVIDIETDPNAHYFVGIDLGTTHCVLSYAKATSEDEAFSQQVMAIPQLTAIS